jgi:hypothetical protein
MRDPFITGSRIGSAARLIEPRLGACFLLSTTSLMPIPENGLETPLSGVWVYVALAINRTACHRLKARVGMMLEIMVALILFGLAINAFWSNSVDAGYFLNPFGILFYFLPRLYGLRGKRSQQRTIQIRRG